MMFILRINATREAKETKNKKKPTNKSFIELDAMNLNVIVHNHEMMQLLF